jgi:hypothetical protein
MENVQVSDLPADVLKKLGYTVNENSQAKVSLAPTRVMARSPDAGASTLKSGGMSAKRPVWLTKLASQMVLVVLTVCLAIWLFYCFCLMLICKKAGSEPGLLIWVPYLQIIPMVRAAGMESSWLWLFYAPWVGGFFLRLPGNGTPHSPITVLAVGVTCLLVQFIAWVVWCFRIVKAREKSPLVALLLLSPIACIIAFFIPDSMMVFRGCFALSTLVLSFGAFLYLAFSSAASPEQPTKKYESMALEVA